MATTMLDSDSSDDTLPGRGRMKLHEEKLLTNEVTDSWRCMPWEVKYYLKLNYKSYYSTKEMVGISPADLLGESLKFCYPEYKFPPSARYFPEFQICDECTRNKCLYINFKENIVMSKWLEKRFYLDYSKVTKAEIDEHSSQLLSEFMESTTRERIRITKLAVRLNKALFLLKMDQEKRCKEETKCEIDEKHEYIKGAIYQILDFLDINVMYNGEGKVDFVTHLGENCKRHCFKVRPDACGYADVKLEGKADQNKIFLVVEVCKSSLITSMETDERISESKSADRGQRHTKLKDKEIIRQLNQEIVSCGPITCSTGNQAHKLYGHLALQLYGALLNNQRKFGIGRRGEETVVGLFIENEFIYLAKISGEDTLTFAKNIWFNMNNANDRLALMSFLYHLNQIHIRSSV